MLCNCWSYFFFPCGVLPCPLIFEYQRGTLKCLHVSIFKHTSCPWLHQGEPRTKLAMGGQIRGSNGERNSLRAQQDELWERRASVSGLMHISVVLPWSKMASSASFSLSLFAGNQTRGRAHGRGDCEGRLPRTRPSSDKPCVHKDGATRRNERGRGRTRAAGVGTSARENFEARLKSVHGSGPSAALGQGKDSYVDFKGSRVNRSSEEPLPPNGSKYPHSYSSISDQTPEITPRTRRRRASAAVDQAATEAETLLGIVANGSLDSVASGAQHVEALPTTESRPMAAATTTIRRTTSVARSRKKASASAHGVQDGVALRTGARKGILNSEDAIQLKGLLTLASTMPQDSAARGEKQESQPNSSDKKTKEAIKPDSFRCDPGSLLPGDHVVHAKLGVCKFIGTRSETPPGREKPIKYLLLKFGDGTAKLSVKQAKQVLYRYGLVGSPGRPISLSKLNDKVGWEKKLSKGQSTVNKMVMDMMEVYVHRLRQRRAVYPKLTQEMEEFGKSFPFTPTADQVQAFEDVERDMTERETPMDRLICGDVGFGKTEVALRAIFRAVLDGRQVMVLAPTTVLAKQHFNVISKRLEKYPCIKVGLLSRFQKEAEKRDILVGIRDGSMHIVAGTHALLGNQVVYHNLGLLVIDEEQRFGVRQKERISSLKTSVDLLTLSATPIPRTLYLSLHGFRDASRITTPPPERRPISTHVSEYSQDIAEKAIKEELERGGQIFYVRPRVEGMSSFLLSLQDSFPSLPMEMAHGRMKPAELEDVMERFSSGQTRLLLCTTIIESGIDIQSANTIIIEDAHLFGLAQIYQLRGRVGRSSIEAHAYLLHPTFELLSSEAQERLTAVKTLGGLGQGYELAQRDMDIRGIGDVFGERQSGDVGGVGYYMFMEMLHNTLNKVEQESLPRLHYDDVKIEIAGSFEEVPESYVPVPMVRERLLEEADNAAREGMQHLLKFCNRMRKEFGEEPPEMELTLKALFLRRIATDLGIERVFVREKSSTVVMNTAMKSPAFQRLVDSIMDEDIKGSLKFQAGRIELRSKYDLSEYTILNRTLACLGQMRNALPSFVNFL